MVNSQCCVPDCNSGYKKSQERASFFTITPSRIKKWGKLLEKKKSKALTSSDVICSKHFDPKDILTHWCAPGCSIKVAYKIPRLKSTAMPCLFDKDFISLKQSNTEDVDMDITMPQEKNVRTYSVRKSYTKKGTFGLEESNVDQDMDASVSAKDNKFNIKCEQEEEIIHMKSLETNNTAEIALKSDYNLAESTSFNRYSSLNNENLIIKQEEEMTIESTLDIKPHIKQEILELDSVFFSDLYNDVVTINLPLHWSKICVPESSSSSRLLVFCNFVYSIHLKLPVQCRKISVDENFRLKFYYGDLLISEIEGLCARADLESSVDSFSKCRICDKGPGITMFDKNMLSYVEIDKITSTWRHVNCPIVLSDDGNCKLCAQLWELMCKLTKEAEIKNCNTTISI